MGYRKDIQILRGISVCFILLFHLGLPGFRGGFLGVDVFFVISGFLMAGFIGKGRRSISIKGARGGSFPPTT